MWLPFLSPRRSPNRGSKSWADRRPTTRFRPRLVNGCLTQMAPSDATVGTTPFWKNLGRFLGSATHYLPSSRTLNC
jgi:hypothetical protein